MAYINDRDIKDKVVKSLMDLGSYSAIDYHTEVDEAFNDLAEDRGIFDTSEIAVDDDGRLTNYSCRQWCVSFFSMRVCEDVAFMNNVEILDDDKYDRKAVKHERKKDKLESKITYPIITGTDYDRTQKTASIVMFRG